MTQDELLEAVRTALIGTSPEGMTGTEIMEAMGYRTPETPRKAIASLLAAGAMEVVPLRRERMNGVAVTVRGYRLK